MTKILDPITFEMVETYEDPSFKQGDVIRCTDASGQEDRLVLNQTYTVIEDWEKMEMRCSFIGFKQVAISEGTFYAQRFELVESSNNAPPLIRATKT